MGFFNKKIKVKFIMLNEHALYPTKAYLTDAGYDLTAISKKETKQYIEYGTGIAMEIPEEYVGLVFPRSSITKKDFMLKNSVGIIDSSYRGEIIFRFLKVYNDLYGTGIYTSSQGGGGQTKQCININQPLERQSEEYKLYEKIGQIIFIKLPNIELELVDKLRESERGSGGFGSSDFNNLKIKTK